jgi:hypothetical protein
MLNILICIRKLIKSIKPFPQNNLWIKFNNNVTFVIALKQIRYILVEMVNSHSHI